MKAMVVTAPYTMECREVPLPVPRIDEARVKVCYTGICGSDVHVYMGKVPTAKKDVIVGHEYSGIIDEIAPGSKDPNGLRPGDKVVGWIVEHCGVCDACIAGHTNLCRSLKCYGNQVDGTFQEYIRVPLRMLHRIPADADLRLYALAEPMSVAVYAVREAPVLLGDTVLVIGGGAIGICTAIAARKAGARRVAISEIARAKIRRIEELGFEAIDAGECDPVNRVMEMTGGSGFDCVFEATGHPSGYELLTKAGSFRAKGLNIGQNWDPAPLVTRDLNAREMRIKAIRIHQQSVFNTTADMFAALSPEELSSLYRLITHDFDLDHLPEAFDFCVHDSSYCKVMVKVNA